MNDGMVLGGGGGGGDGLIPIFLKICNLAQLTKLDNVCITPSQMSGVRGLSCSNT